MSWFEVIVDVLSGLVIIIPLVVELVKYVKIAAKERNWDKLLGLIANLMMQAESKFDNGEDRKEWVVMMVKASADTINYDIDIEQVERIIDSLCVMSKNVNTSKIKNK